MLTKIIFDDGLCFDCNVGLDFRYDHCN